MYYESPDEATLEQVFTTINALDLSSATITTPKAPATPAARSAAAVQQRAYGHFRSAEDAVQVVKSWPRSYRSREYSAVHRSRRRRRASVLMLLSKFGKQTMKIMNAVLQERRVLFLAKMAPTKEVCDLVLSACCPCRRHIWDAAGVSYANLNDLDWLEVKGYIAGVTNPVFEGNSNWWDLLCNLDTGKVQTAAEYARAKAAQSSSVTKPRCCARARDTWGNAHENIDRVFIERVLGGARLRFGERWVRAQFRDFTQRLMDLAFAESAIIVDRSSAEDGESR